MDDALPMYTVQKITKEGDLFGLIHGSLNANFTLCGKATDERWYILTNCFDGDMTCEKCKRIFKNDREKIYRNIL